MSAFGDIPARLTCALAVTMSALIGSARAEDRIEPPPRDLESVQIVEHYNVQVPLDLTFTDSQGRNITLADCFNGEKPVILNLGYYRCPMLCPMVLNAMVAGMEEMTWTVGEEFRVVSVSINPREKPAEAATRKDHTLAAYEREIEPEAWRFLVGAEDQIQKLADTVGFRFAPTGDDFAHAATIIICTPDGRVSQYLRGVRYEPTTLRLSLVEASEGKIGSALDQVLLYCFHYDPSSGTYTAEAQRLMQIVGLFTVLLLMVGIGSWWTIGARRRRRALAAPEAPSQPKPQV